MVNDLMTLPVFHLTNGIFMYGIDLYHCHSRCLLDTTILQQSKLTHINWIEFNGACILTKFSCIHKNMFHVFE